MSVTTIDAGGGFIRATRESADRLRRVIAAANRALDALEDAHSTGRDFCAQMVALRDALVAAGMREAAR